MKSSVPLWEIRETPVSARRRNKELTLQVAQLIRERDWHEQYTRDHTVPRPDPNTCPWHLCMDWSSKRYGIPLCDTHARMVASRIDHIDEVRRKEPTYSGEVKLLMEKVARRDAEIALLRAPVKRIVPTDGTIYFLQIGGHIKIGWASDLSKRMRQYPPNAELLAAHPGTRKDELRLHKMFKVHCSHGNEWYPLVPVILAHIDRVVAEHGRPADVRFGAKPTEVPQRRPHQYIGGDRIGSGSTPRTVRG